MMINNEHHYDTASMMMEYSPYHSDYTLADKRMYLEPPLAMGNYIFGLDADEVPYLFATWAFPRQKQIDEYVRTGIFPLAHGVVMAIVLGLLILSVLLVAKA